MGAPNIINPISSGGGGGGGVSGSGTLNTLAKWTSTGSTVGNSIIQDNGNRALLTGASGANSGWYASDSTRLAYLLSSAASSGLPAVGTDTAHDFTFVTGATEQMRLTVAGRLGIGTTTPSFKLDINSNVAAIGPTTAAPGLGGNWRYRDDTATVRWLTGILGTAGATSWTLYDVVNSRYVIQADSTGNVGIGNASPSTLLHVGSSTTAASVLARVNTAGGADQVPVFSAFRAGVQEVAMWVPVTATGGLGFALNPAGYTDAQLSAANKVMFTTSGGIQATGTSAASPAFGSSGTSKAGVYFPSSPNHTLRFASGSAATLAGEFSATGDFSFNSGYGSAAVAYGCRAWANFDGVNAGTFAGGVSTVSRAAGSTTATVTTTTAHGLSTGNVVYALTGVAAGAYTVTVLTGTTFTITTVATTLLSAVSITFQFANVRASGNVNSVAKIATGQYAVNLTTPMPDTNYSVTATLGYSNSDIARCYDEVAPRTVATFRVIALNFSFLLADNQIFQCAVMR